MNERIPRASLDVLYSLASDAMRGRILCFGRWTADYGDPIDWHLNPTNGKRWDPRSPGPKAFADEARVGDVKLTWEIARFPHAFQMARASAFRPEMAHDLATALVGQLEQFNDANEWDRGVHWASGQEIAHRLFAWLFALRVLLVRSAHGVRASALVCGALRAGAEHIERHFDYARFAVYNNHLINEALGLYAAGVLLADTPEARRWRELGRSVLVEEAKRQFYSDGAYIQLSHNYQRSALQAMLWAVLLARASGDQPADAWLEAMDRSLEFLVAHQNPSDGRLPNSGANDGALPSVLSTCDFSDFRPTLQAVSVAVRAKRLYPPGPWDEAAAWYFGPRVLDLPLEEPTRTSRSFPTTGYHVMRGNDAGSFAALRCGSIRDRFAQIDMLHLDVWWRGTNVLADGGSYLYNGPAEWHDHFQRTGSHNTVVIDERDQMLHFRRFKNLYWTKARVLGFDVCPEWTLCTGEHYGYVRHPGACVHRRSVLFVKDDLWVVADSIRGSGEHRARLQWLAGDDRAAYCPERGRMTMETPHGPFSVSVFDEQATPVAGTVVAGRESPPRGWISRYYAEKVPAASLEVEASGPAPLTLISVIGPGEPALTSSSGVFSVTTGSGALQFRVTEGIISPDALAQP